MARKSFYLALITVLSIVAATFWLSGCASPAIPTSPMPTTLSATPGSPGVGAVVNSDSIVTAKIQAIRQQNTGYPWELDILVQTSTDVDSLTNPTKDSVGKVITVKTDQDVAALKVNDIISAKVKYVGDVPKPGITLYIYDITKG